MLFSSGTLYILYYGPICDYFPELVTVIRNLRIIKISVLNFVKNSKINLRLIKKANSRNKLSLKVQVFPIFYII